MSYRMTLRSLRNTDYRVTKNLMRTRFCEADTDNFVDMWYYRNYDASVCIEYEGCMLGFALVVENKLEYLVVHERFSSIGLGRILVNIVLEILKEDFKTVHLITADNPLLRGWYAKLGFELSSTTTDEYGITGDLMVYRFRTKRAAAAKKVSYR